MEHVFKSQQLPSGKVITRHFGEDGSLLDEQHVYGTLDIGIAYEFRGGIKVGETYFSKRRLVSRRSYEKARAVFPDMPPADNSIEDWGGSLVGEVRKQQRQNKAEADRHLAQSVESRFPRPTSTNWLRVISGDKAHLVIFASRDWKVLARERSIPTGREWLQLFGFCGPPDSPPSVAKGLEVGYEVAGDREVMLNASRTLLTEVIAFIQNPPGVRRWSGSIRPRPKPRKQPPIAWPTMLPPLIDFLSGLTEPTVKIFNHHR